MTTRSRHARGSSWPVLMFVSSAPLLYICWVVFVGTSDKWDLVAGIAGALIGAFAMCVVERADRSHFAPSLRDWMQIGFVPWLLVQGTYAIVLVGLRDLVGGRKAVSAFRIARFNAGSRGNPRDTGRRVLAVAYTTMSPTSIVLGVNTGKDHLVFHEIDRSGVSRMTKNLGAVA